jgi:lipoprotein-releasing system permease protein
MFRPIVCFIGLRYTRPKQKDRFISFVSVASILGITLGVMTLICVLSVMNGFDYEIRSRIFHLVPQVLVTGQQASMLPDASLVNKVTSTPHVKAIAPYVEGYAMLKHNGDVKPVMLRGVNPAAQQKVTPLFANMLSGSLDQLVPGEFGLVIGQQLALQLGVQLNSTLNVFTPNVTVTPLGVWPQVKRFKVVGIFEESSRLGLGSSMAYINIQDAQALYHLNKHITGYRVSVDDLYIAPHVSNQLAERLDWKLVVSDWTQKYAAFFKAIAMEKTMMFLILLLIVAVAVFNLVASMVMVVNSKRADIAILRTLGASRTTILLTFIIQGCFIGFSGTIIGTIGGVALARHISGFVEALQGWLHVHFVSASIYFIDHLPSRIMRSDVVLITSVALVMTLMATLYPAWRAACVQPAEALRYE